MDRDDRTEWYAALSAGIRDDTDVFVTSIFNKIGLNWEIYVTTNVSKI